MIGGDASCCAAPRPRTALAVGTPRWSRTSHPGQLATVLMFTDLVYAAVLYGTPATARRVPLDHRPDHGRPSRSAPSPGCRTPEALLIGVVTGLVSFTPALTGWIVRNHRDAAEAARLRAEQTALLAEMDRTQAVVAERARMARELHDMVANHLSAIAIHSTAALSIDDPDTSREALGVIRENSVRGAGRDAPADRAAAGRGGDDRSRPRRPRSTGSDALVEQARTNGRRAGWTSPSTTDRTARRRCPPRSELAAYRIVQESLTNALKHAAPGRVTVRAATAADGALERRA